MMKKQFEWSKSYETGVERIDHQHRYFLELIAWLADHLFKPLDSDLKLRCIEEVIRYAQFHFFSEENLMIAIRYPLYEEHRKLHMQLVNELQIKISKLRHGNHEYLQFIDFLIKWFNEHTISEDVKIGRHLRQTDLPPKQ